MTELILNDPNSYKDFYKVPLDAIGNPIGSNNITPSMAKSYRELSQSEHELKKINDQIKENENIMSSNQQIHNTAFSNYDKSANLYNLLTKTFAFGEKTNEAYNYLKDSLQNPNITEKEFNKGFEEKFGKESLNLFINSVGENINKDKGFSRIKAGYNKRLQDGFNARPNNNLNLIVNLSKQEQSTLGDGKITGYKNGIIFDTQTIDKDDLKLDGIINNSYNKKQGMYGGAFLSSITPEQIQELYDKHGASALMFFKAMLSATKESDIDDAIKKYDQIVNTLDSNFGGNKLKEQIINRAKRTHKLLKETLNIGNLNDRNTLTYKYMDKDGKELSRKTGFFIDTGDTITKDTNSLKAKQIELEARIIKYTQDIGEREIRNEQDKIWSHYINKYKPDIELKDNKLAKEVFISAMNQAKVANQTFNVEEFIKNFYASKQ